MDPLIFQSVFFGLFVGGAILLYSRSKLSNHPPGPSSLPIIGNILLIVRKANWLAYSHYQDIYGDLVFFHGLGNHVLVLNTMEAITDLLERRAALYSGRPSFTVANELVGLHKSMVCLPCNSEWRAQRKLAHSVLGVGAVKKYHRLQEDLSAILAGKLIDTPQEFFGHVRLVATRLILTITYGLSANKSENALVAQPRDTLLMTNRILVPGSYLCDLLPWMKYLPAWVPFRREAQVCREMVDELATYPFEYAKEQIRTGKASGSLVEDLLASSFEDRDIHESRVKWTAGGLNAAGGETTYTTILSFILAMALYPDKQRAAQREIDEVLGPDGFPTIHDRDKLPYVNAIIRETMRWRPALPLGIAHCTTKDDLYRGFTIPEGTIVIPNVWAVSLEKYGSYDPHSFIPERFLGEGGPPDPMSWAFGFGRRQCPGRYLAENSVFIFAAVLLTVFDISPPHGDSITSPEPTNGLINYPTPFTCNIDPRTPEKVSQVMERIQQRACTHHPSP